MQTWTNKLLSKLFERLSEAHDVPEYAVALLIPLLGAALCFFSSDCSPSAVRWRKSLRKSGLSPSPAVSAIIWMYVYIAMGHSSYLVYARFNVRTVISTPLIVYLIQCLLNHFFIIVLFGLQRIDLALVMMIPLWLATALTALFFFEISFQAGVLMSTVLVWITIHVYLNAFLFAYNDVYTEAVIASPPSSPVHSKNKLS